MLTSGTARIRPAGTRLRVFREGVPAKETFVSTVVESVFRRIMSESSVFEIMEAVARSNP
jgi:hypothetical protein